MSYILEALKKSDKERQQEEIPDLKADHSKLSSRRKERKLPSWRRPGVIVSGVICAGAFLWWQLSANQQVPVAKSSEKTVPVVSYPENISPKTSQIPEKSVAVRPPVTEQITKKDPESVVTSEQVPTIPPALAQRKPIAVETTEVSLPARQKEVPLPPFMEELPVEVRAGIPDLSFAGHVYSDAAPKRLIIINNRIVREGDLISNGLFLEQINPDGVVLKYETSVFRVKLF